MPMAPIERIKKGQRITSEEFQELGRNTDWSGYTRTVVEKMSRVADAYELAQARSRAKGSQRVYC